MLARCRIAINGLLATDDSCHGVSKATINTQGLGSGIYMWEAKAGLLTYGKGKITLMEK